MSQSGSERSNDDDDEVHVEMGDLYGGEYGSEMSEEHNIQASSKFPAGIISINLVYIYF